MGIQCRCPVAGVAQGKARTFCELRGLATRRLGQLERGRVVMGDELGMVLFAAKGLHPCARSNVLVRPRGARYLSVGHLPDEHMAKCELLLPRNCRATLAANEALAFER